MKRLFLLAILTSLFISANSQNLSYSCPRDTTIGCGTACLTLTGIVPDIRSQSSDYSIVNVSSSSTCRPYVDPAAPGTSTTIVADDVYGPVVPLPFSFVFYGTVYNSLIISPNGLISFLTTNAGLGTTYATSAGNLPNIAYDPAIFMGPYHDMDISQTTSPTAQIKYEVTGTAPNRKWILSFYKVPLFYSGNGCAVNIDNTQEMVLHESSGILEADIVSRIPCPAWQAGRGMVGIQDETRTKAVMAPGRTTTDPLWGTVNMNEVWRFIPKNGVPLYRSTQLLNATGAVVATGDTTRINAANFLVSFPNICPPVGGPTVYVIKTTYARIDDNTQTFYSLDTVRVTKINSLPLTASFTQTNCGGSTGTVTANTSGGTAPFTYTLTPPGTTQSTNVFTGLAAGTYSLTATDALGCTNTVPVTVTAATNLPGSAVTTPTACPAVSNGTITVTTTGTAPVNYSLDGGPAQSSNIFTNVASGSHNITFTDAIGCSGSTTATVVAGVSQTATSVFTATNCPTSANGTITITPSNGTGPFTFSLDGGTPQASGIFTNVAAGTHSVLITSSVGCTVTKSVTVTSGTGFTATASATNTACGSASTGTITVTITSGTGPFTYSLDGGTPQASTLFSGVSSGPHNVVITDAGTCSVTVSATVLPGGPLTGSAASTPASCSSATDGTITITPTSGTPPYTFSLDGGPSQSSGIFTNVLGGLHNVLIRDVNTCPGNVAVTVSVNTSFTATTAFTQTTCATAANGSITVTPAPAGTYTYSLDGGTFQASALFTGVLSGPHVITVKDVAGCTTTANVTITSGTGITGTASSTVASCTSISDGTITATATTGTAPYTYSLDGGTSQASNIFTNVSSGAHTITITDINTCTASVPVNVGTASAFTASATFTTATCPTAPNGSITVTVTGTGTFTYSLDAGTFQASPIFNSVLAGPHVITVKDITGCTATTNITVTAGTGITGSAVSTPASCSVASNGAITATATSGTAPFNYSLDGGAPQGSAIFNNVSSGPHTIVISDVNTCSVSVPVTVSAGPALTATTTSVATSCPTVNNGSITVLPTSGAGPYLYTLDGGTPQPGSLFNNVAAGSHTITFTDGIGCPGNVSSTVPAGSPIDATGATTPTSCPAVSNGTIIISAPTGTAPYTYSLDGGTAQNNPLYTGVSSGPHSVTVTDINGCTKIVSVTVAQGSPITAVATPVPTTCPGVNNGSITISGETGTSPYTYSIDGGASQSGATFTNLSPGPHTIIITDANGCTATVSATITQGAGIQATATAIVSTSCPTVNNGSITVTPTTGTAPYSYSIDGGASQASATFNNLTATSHTVSITDVLGCTGTVTATVPQGVVLTSTLSPVNPPCANINDGVITIIPTTGVSPYLYSINGGTPQASNQFPGLAPGLYNISFTDNIGCNGTNSVTLVTNTSLALNATVSEPLCNGASNGTIVLSASGGVSPYQYSKDAGVVYQSSSTFSGLIAGTYTFTVKDNVGCTHDTTIVLGEPTVLIASAVSTTSTCNGNDGTITISQAGGTTPYSYSINNGATYQASPVFTVSFGDYNNVLVKDSNGCIANTSTTVVLVDNMFIDAGLDTTVCFGSAKTFQPLTNTETTGFVWTTLNGNPVDTIRNATVIPNDTATYIVIATWGVCTKQDTVTVNVLPKPVSDAGLDQRVCIGDSARLFGSWSNIPSNLPLPTHLWTPTFLVSDSSITNPWALMDSSQIFTFTVYDNYGCNFAVSNDVLITVQPPVPAFAGNDTTAIIGIPFQLTGTGGVQYTWSSNTGILNNPTSATPMATITNDAWFVVEVKDIAGCIGYDTVLVQAYEGPTYYLPNAFSPNRDGLNDVFRPIPVGIARTEWFRVFNRYGEMVFETNQWLKGWDGTYKGKPQASGAYVWVIKGYDRKGTAVEMKGTVLIVQ